MSSENSTARLTYLTPDARDVASCSLKSEAGGAESLAESVHARLADACGGCRERCWNALLPQGLQNRIGDLGF